MEPGRAAAHLGTVSRMKDTAGHPRRSCAVPQQLGFDLLPRDVDSTMGPATRPTTLTSRTSATATKTTTTSITSVSCVPSADSILDPDHAAFPLQLLILLADAWHDCRRTKRRTRAAQAFELDQERLLIQIRDQLLAGTWQPGRYIRFGVDHPKLREIWAAPFEERVVHWFWINAISGLFYRHFIYDTFACIPGRGVLLGAERLEHHARSATRNWSRNAYFLKCDISNFFLRIHKPTAFDLLTVRIKDPWLLELGRKILFHDPRQDYETRSGSAILARVPSHKLLTSQDADHGLPMGNLPSQFIAGVVLDALDQFVKHVLKAKHYVRYVDDFILIHESPQQLNEWKRQIEALLQERLGLELNPRKTVLQPCHRGIDFVGQVITPRGRYLRRSTFNNALSRLERMPACKVFASANSYLGLCRQTTLNRTDRQRIGRICRRRGHVVSASLTKICRRSA